jgi:serine/threonine-protein kinase
MTFRTGETVGDYEILGVLGTGGMGRVFRVRNRISDRLEAMKVVLPDAPPEPALTQRFLREIKLHASLDHPNIAGVRTALCVDDQIVMVMELVEGSNLAALLRTGRLSVPAALSYADQVLAALAYAHSRGVIHRDIKPANIIVAPSGVVKVTDFGIARTGGTERLTMTGMALGSLYYMSPEQIKGGAADVRSDIYSLGVTLYEMVTGAPPIRGENEYAIMHGHLTEEPAPPEQLVPDLPATLSAAILCAIAKAPEQRFQSAEEFRAALNPNKPQAYAAPPLVPAKAQPVAHLDTEQVAKVESQLVRVIGPIARHLVSQAARRASNIEDLISLLASQVPNERERDTFLRGCSLATTSSRNLTTGTTDSAELDPKRLEDARRKLAVFVGPAAKVLVDRAFKKARSTGEFYTLLADAIPTERERKSFLSSTTR